MSDELLCLVKGFLLKRNLNSLANATREDYTDVVESLNVLEKSIPSILECGVLIDEAEEEYINLSLKRIRNAVEEKRMKLVEERGRELEGFVKNMVFKNLKSELEGVVEKRGE